jgi:hypothetical protein
MAHRRPLPVDVLAPAAGAGQAHRFEQALAHDRVPEPAVDDLHDAGEDRVAERGAVAVQAAPQHGGAIAEQGRSRRSFGACLHRVTGARKSQEDIVEVWRLDAQGADLDRRGVEAIEDGAERAHVAVARDLEAQVLLVTLGLAEQAGHAAERFAIGELQLDVAARDQALELVWRLLRDDPTRIEEGDVMGEAVRLLEVLRRVGDPRAGV